MSRLRFCSPNVPILPSPDSVDACCTRCCWLESYCTKASSSLMSNKLHGFLPHEKRRISEENTSTVHNEYGLDSWIIAGWDSAKCWRYTTANAHCRDASWNLSLVIILSNDGRQLKKISYFSLSWEATRFESCNPNVKNCTSTFLNLGAQRSTIIEDKLKKYAAKRDLCMRK